jgi:soluble lytic murein transglycosylase-like protein
MMALLSANMTTQEIIQKIRAKAAAAGIDTEIAVAQLRRESAGFNPHYVFGPGKSPAGAMGLAQFMPGTWATYGRGNPYNVDDALEAWAKYMRKLLNQFGGRYDLALAGYNSGENRAEYAAAARAGRAINWAVLPRGVQSETQEYVRVILANAGRFSNPTRPPRPRATPAAKNRR